MAVEQKDVSMQYTFLQALAIAYTTINDPQHAKEMLRKLQLVDIGNKPESKKYEKFFINYIQGLIAECQGLPAVSRFFHREAYNAVWADSLPPSMAINEAWQLGRTYQMLHRPDSAMSWLRRSEQMAVEYRQPAHLQKIYVSMAELANSTGDTAANKHFSLKARAIEDSLFSRSNYLSSRDKLTQYEELVKDTTIEELHEKLVIQWTVIIAVIVILALVVVFTAVLAKRNRALRFANTKLVDRNRELIALDDANTRLMDKALPPTADTPLPIDEPQAASAENDSADAKAQPYLSEEQTNAILSRVRRVLDTPAHLFNPEFSLDMLAELAGTNSKYVSHVINTTYGKNFRALINECRIREASKRLEDHENYGSYTIQAIGEDLGYKSPTSFILAFKKIVGMTPSVYQKLSVQPHQ